METWPSTEYPLRSAAQELVARMGVPAAGVVLGSGFGDATSGFGPPRERIRFAEIAGLLAPRVDGHDAQIESYELGGSLIWVFRGRLHLYEGHSVSRVAQAVRVLSFAGAEAVLLTCAAGGLRDDDVPGSYLFVADHLDLTGTDPISAIPSDLRDPAFPDLQRVYDRAILDRWTASAREQSIAWRPGVLAAVSGPCYETPAEVRMLRTLGADAVTMSTVPESVVAHYLGLRVGAIACIANRGAGMADGGIRHDEVVAAVAGSVSGQSAFFRNAALGMLGTGPR
jgi:inosine/guanosine/xanthosine phosphorylase family protein